VFFAGGNNKPRGLSQRLFRHFHSRRARSVNVIFRALTKAGTGHISQVFRRFAAEFAFSAPRLPLRQQNGSGQRENPERL